MKEENNDALVNVSCLKVKMNNNKIGSIVETFLKEPFSDITKE